MNEFERKFYEAGIADARGTQYITLACWSNRFAKLCRELNVQIGDKRGDSVKAYNCGVAYEISLQAMMA
jgi:hypothetical protein